MPRVFVLSGPDVGKSVAFDGDAVLGRSPDVAVVLRSPSVSRRHARIVHDGTRWWLEDLGSINGTTLQGRRVEREVLEDGALFKLGDLELRFRHEAEPGSGGGSSTTVLEGDESSTGDEAQEGTFELEGDWDEDVPPPARPARPARPVQAAPGRRPAERRRPASDARAALEATQVRRGEQTTAAGGRVLQYRKVADRRGFFAADLAQYPLWVRLLVGVLVLALFVGLTWGTFHLTAMLRGRGAPDVNAESAP